MNGKVVSRQEVIDARRKLQDLTVAHWRQADIHNRPNTKARI